VTRKAKIPLKEIPKDIRCVIMAIAARIKFTRLESGLRQVDLADACQLDYRHFQDIEGGKCNFSLATLIKISQGLGVELSELI